MPPHHPFSSINISHRVPVSFPRFIFHCLRFCPSLSSFPFLPPSLFSRAHINTHTNNTLLPLSFISGVCVCVCVCVRPSHRIQGEWKNSSLPPQTRFDYDTQFVWRTTRCWQLLTPLTLSFTCSHACNC